MENPRVFRFFCLKETLYSAVFVAFLKEQLGFSVVLNGFYVFFNLKR